MSGSSTGMRTKTVGIVGLDALEVKSVPWKAPGLGARDGGEGDR